MRYEVTEIVGDEERKQLVPLQTMLAIPGQFDGKTFNDLVTSDLPPESWEPWVVWHSLKVRQGEDRDYEAWVNEIDWWTLLNAPSAPDPSGDQENQTDAPSQSSSLGAPAPGPSSSSSTTTSSMPSGLRSPEA